MRRIRRELANLVGVLDSFIALLVVLRCASVVLCFRLARFPQAFGLPVETVAMADPKECSFEFVQEFRETNACFFNEIKDLTYGSALCRKHGRVCQVRASGGDGCVPDVVTLGPPRQPFSFACSNRKSTPAHLHEGLEVLRQFLQYVAEVKPRGGVLEEVTVFLFESSAFGRRN
jgi:hypothetical protein